MITNSPADIAGLRPHTDYIIGADTVLHDVSMIKDLYGAIQKVCHRPRGEGGSSKIVTKTSQNSYVTAYEKIL